MNTDEDKRLCNLIAKCLAYGRKVGIVSDDDNIACLNLLMRKDTSWSKEDRRMLDIIISELEQDGEDVNVPGLYHLEIDFLKSIRPEPSWKPSEEQMDCLCAAVDAAIRKHNESVSGHKPARVLKSLYEQLRKLM